MIDTFSKIKSLLYIFQLSEYDAPFFLNWVRNHPDLENYLKTKKEPVWTLKAKLIFALTILFSPFYLVFPKKLYCSLVLSCNFIKPLETIIIFILVQKVKSKLKKHNNLIKIGIAGSYGKTTTKEFLAEILSSRYRVLKTPENINTLLGVARLILKKLNEDYHVLIVEMATYKKGGIKKLCRMINPEMGILTGLNASHLERFGSLDNIIKAKFEILKNLFSEGKSAFLNADNPLIIKNFQIFFKNRVDFYGLNPEVEKTFNAKNIKISEKGLEFEIFKNGKFYFSAKVGIFGRHQIGPILLAISVADKLRLSKEEIITGIKNLKPLPRRLFITKSREGITVIDDSYNISKDSIKTALEFLKEVFPANRKIIITAGLVEQGSEKSENNKWFGEKLKEVGDLILLIKNSNTPFLLKGIGVPKNKILEYNNAKELNSVLPRIFKSGDAVLIFPYDLPDHYY